MNAHKRERKKSRNMFLAIYQMIKQNVNRLAKEEEKKKKI